MDGVRKDLLTLSKQQSAESKDWTMSHVKIFLNMQIAIISILMSVAFWLILTIVEIARKKVGISIVLVATFYTCLMLVSHGVSLQFTQSSGTDYVLENYSSSATCPKVRAPKLCAFSKQDVAMYQATFYTSYVGVGMLAMYAAFLLFIRRVEEEEYSG
eukprot:CAMPEP_0197581130 /NCGR_PEP_ID=MMETSP1326-20131121/4743_1 /TAXON_ID=1155430 /ORGANISM="Genus nov. species nov., Strain RCC2288" /LENGTH=157 /DNA_ID=CAMNT_0043144989 /DNA_START=134 /DNA_END=604 /DNA_ORIENTATION=-